MKREYDFTKAVRGKFYSEKSVYHQPIYLDPEIESFCLRYRAAK